MGYHTFMIEVLSQTDVRHFMPLSVGKWTDGEPEPEKPPEPYSHLFLREGRAGSADLLHVKVKNETKIASNLPYGPVSADWFISPYGSYGYCARCVSYGTYWYVAYGYLQADGMIKVDHWTKMWVDEDYIAERRKPWSYVLTYAGRNLKVRTVGFVSSMSVKMAPAELQGCELETFAETHGFWKGGWGTSGNTGSYYPSYWGNYTMRYLPAPPGQLPSFTFRHNELNAYYGWNDLKLLPNLYRNGFACAFTEAAKRLPYAATNSLANFVELAAAIISISRGLKEIARAGRYATAWAEKLDLGTKGVSLGVTDFKNPFRATFKRPKDLWLAYRYSYCTTKSDIEEYSTLIRQLSQLPDDEHVKVGGGFWRDDMYFRATAEFCVAKVLPQEVYDMVGTFNAELSARNAWDLIPFSFVVDWFLKIGDSLERFEVFNKAQEIKPTKVWFSYHSSYPTVDNRPQDIYLRINGSDVKLGNPWWAEQKTSLRTKLFRIVDSLALFG